MAQQRSRRTRDGSGEAPRPGATRLFTQRPSLRVVALVVVVALVLGPLGLAVLEVLAR